MFVNNCWWFTFLYINCDESRRDASYDLHCWVHLRERRTRRELFTLRASRRGPFVLSFLRQVGLNKSAPKHRTRKISEKLFEAGGSELRAPKHRILANFQRSSVRQVGLSWVLQSAELSQILREALWGKLVVFLLLWFSVSTKTKHVFLDFLKDKNTLPNPRIWPFTMQCSSKLLTDLSANQN